ncbi:MAG: glycosyltransferase [Lachnospiraceae bacterium]|nr:glycosyltransferase [Lachnospiraceae bacterium]
MGDLISVIVPVYNMEKYLKRCVESILAQEYRQLEIILVDDGSTDNSPAMCDAYAKQDERICVIHKENGGLSDARNAGLAIATGSFIGFVDSDDWIEPEMYKDMYEAAKKHQAEVVVCRYAEVYPDRVVDGSCNELVVLTREEVLNIFICEHPRYKIYNSVWSKLFKREIIGNTIFPKGRNSEDIVFTTKAFCRLERCVYIDTAYYNYVREREGSIMNGFAGDRMLKDEIPFWREHIACIHQVKEELGQKAEYYFYKRLVGYYLSTRTTAKKQKELKRYATALLSEIQKDKARIQQIYNCDFVKKSDKYRMWMVLNIPEIYVMIENVYQKLIIPFRNR